MLDDKRLAEIEARCNAATPGPWKNVGGYCDVCASDREKEANRQANAEFVVHARADVPDLLAEVKRLRAEMAVCLSTKGGGWACAAS